MACATNDHQFTFQETCDHLWQFMLKIIRKVVEKIMVQGIGNAAQQSNVDIVLAENLVDMRTGAANLFCQLRGRRALLSHHFFYMLPDVHEKAWNWFNLLAIGFPRPLNNKLFHAKKGVS